MSLSVSWKRSLNFFCGLRVRLAPARPALPARFFFARLAITAPCRGLRVEDVCLSLSPKLKFREADSSIRFAAIIGPVANSNSLAARQRIGANVIAEPCAKRAMAAIHRHHK